MHLQHVRRPGVQVRVQVLLQRPQELQVLALQGPRRGVARRVGLPAPGHAVHDHPHRQHRLQPLRRHAARPLPRERQPPACRWERRGSGVSVNPKAAASDPRRRRWPHGSRRRGGRAAPGPPGGRGGRELPAVSAGSRQHPDAQQRPEPGPGGPVERLRLHRRLQRHVQPLWQRQRPRRGARHLRPGHPRPWVLRCFAPAPDRNWFGGLGGRSFLFFIIAFF